MAKNLYDNVVQWNSSGNAYFLCNVNIVAGGVGMILEIHVILYSNGNGGILEEVFVCFVLFFCSMATKFGEKNPWP